MPKLNILLHTVQVKKCFYLYSVSGKKRNTLSNRYVDYVGLAHLYLHELMTSKFSLFGTFHIGGLQQTIKESTHPSRSRTTPSSRDYSPYLRDLYMTNF